MINFEQIKMIYKFGRKITFSDIQVLINQAKNESLDPSDYIIKEGSLRKRIFFIKKGLIRSFTINEKGEEITIALFWENQPFASTDCILFNQSSRHYFQALEPTTVLSMDYDLLQNIISNNPKLSESRKFVFQNIIKRALDRIESFVLYSPEERYARFIKTNPDIVNRVPNKYLANVLGITPVSLSRIRKRMATKKK